MLPVLATLPAMADIPAPVDGVVAGQNISGDSSGGYRLDNLNSDLIISESAFTGNSYDGNGAAAWATSGHNLEVKDSVFTGNTVAGIAGAFGGGTKAGFLKVSGSKFIDNHAELDGGAIASYAGLAISNSVFDGNSAQYAADENGEYNVPVVDGTPIGGGALALGAVSNTTIAAIDSTVFKNNVSGANGGAIGTRLASDADNSAAKLDIAATFENNTAAKSGGAIYNTFYANNGLGKGDGVTVTGIFTGNKAGVSGGAIYNDGATDKAGNFGGVMTVNNAAFTANSATDEGGAIFNKGNMTVVGSKFADNNVVDGFGGAIKNNGQMTIENSVFEDNIAYSNGAVSTSGKTGSTKISGATFKDNSALADGGALGLYLDATVTDTVFEDNKSAFGVEVAGTKYDAASDANGGGALMVGQKATATLKNVKFIDNETGATGGAIHARHHKKDNAYLNIDGALFDDNEAKVNGGAIATIYDGEVNINNAQFVSNSAAKNGGAIYNGVDMNYGSSDGTGSLSTDHGTINFTGENVFRGNVAGINGGAIYNDAGGTINFAGVNTFADNTLASGTKNDIYNLGTVNVLSGTTNISGGITGNTGILNIGADAVLNMATSNINQSAIVIDGTVNADVLNSDKYAKLQGAVSGNGKLNLNVGSVGTYRMFSSANDIAIDAGATYTVTNNGADGVIIETKSVDVLAKDTGLSERAAGAISGLANSKNTNIQKVSLEAQKALNSGDVEFVEKETAKLNPEDKPVTQSVASSVQNQVLALTSGRMSGGVANIGRAGGDETAQESGFWAQGLFNKTKNASNFHGYTRGFALGMDTVIDRKYTLGFGFAYNNTDVHSGSRSTDINSDTLFVYGQYKPSDWYVNATLTYTMAEYTENVDPFGVAIESNYDVDTYGAQLMTGYDLAYGFTPEAGLRYLHITQDTYNNGVNTIKGSDTDFLSGVAGLKYTFAIETENALQLRPEMRAAATYDFISDKAETTVVMPGTGSYKVGGERLSRFGGEFGIGLTAEYKGMEFSVSYDLGLHEDYTSQTGMIKFRSQF